MAAFAAPALSTSTQFMARRPLTTASLIAAKLKMTLWSTLAAWLLVVSLSVVALMLSGRMPVVVERARAGIDVTGTARGIAVVLAWFAASPPVPRYFLGAIAILSVPLARVSAAPLALAWSRHR